MGDDDYSAKAQELQNILQDKDLWRLREMALSEGGLVNDTIRQKAWPLLTGLYTKDELNYIPNTVTLDDDTFSIASEITAPTHHRIEIRSADASQIQLDVNRCTWHLLTGSQRVQRLQMEHKRNKKVARIIARKQRRLANLINLTLSWPHEKLRYYQGYHDVACIMLSTLGEPDRTHSQVKDPIQALGLTKAANVLHQISHSHFKDCLQKNFIQLQTALRLTIFPLIALFDPQVHDHLESCHMEPFFALSWIITWFAHEIRDTELVKRIFDACLSSHPLFSFYVAVAMVTHPYNRREILETECDFAAVHSTLTGLPKNSSLFGWKYRPGDGYVSDDACDEGTVSTGGLDNENPEFLVVGLEKAASDENAVNVSLTTMSLDGPRVPFQELIDRALLYMHKIPPRKLLALATKYYGKEKVRQILKPDIAVFGNVPSWMKTAYPVPSSEIDQPFLEEEINQFLREHSKNRAVIAAGFGRGDIEERRRRKRRRVMIAGAIAVALIAVAIGLWTQYQRRQSRLADESSPKILSTSAIDNSKVTTVSDMPKSKNQLKAVPVPISPSVLKEAPGIKPIDVDKEAEKKRRIAIEAPKVSPVKIENEGADEQKQSEDTKPEVEKEKSKVDKDASKVHASRMKKNDTNVRKRMASSRNASDFWKIVRDEPPDLREIEAVVLRGENKSLADLSFAKVPDTLKKVTSDELHKINAVVEAAQRKILESEPLLKSDEDRTTPLQSLVEILNSKWNSTMVLQSTISQGKAKSASALAFLGQGFRVSKSTISSIRQRLDESPISLPSAGEMKSDFLKQAKLEVVRTRGVLSNSTSALKKEGVALMSLLRSLALALASTIHRMIGVVTEKGRQSLRQIGDTLVAEKVQAITRKASDNLHSLVHDTPLAPKVRSTLQQMVKRDNLDRLKVSMSQALANYFRATVRFFRTAKLSILDVIRSFESKLPRAAER